MNSIKYIEYSVIDNPTICFEEGKGDEIKSKQASKRDRTLTLREILRFWAKLDSNRMLFKVSKNRMETLVEN